MMASVCEKLTFVQSGCQSTSRATIACENRCPILHARFRGNASATEHLQLPMKPARALTGGFKPRDA